MLVDRFSRLVRFVPAHSPTAIFAARAIILWAVQRGLPLWLISDGGSHFKNQLIVNHRPRTVLLGGKKSALEVMTGTAPWNSCCGAA